MSDQTDDQQTPGHDTSVSPFDAIKHVDADGAEYWSARELAKLLGYTEYGKFHGAITRAESACETSEHEVSDHFAHVSDMITVGKGARRRVQDVRLSRYACYLIVQNADPEKPIVALGQTYFAVQTRRQELADQRLLQGMSEDERRLYVRDQLAEHNRSLAGAAASAGVISPRDFAVFQDHGYMGLYGGERARDIAARKGLAPGQRILDHMGSTELAANLFRATQTDEKLRRDGIQGRDEANATHHAVGRAVRKTIEELGGTMPEDLPTPNESIRQVRRKEQARALHDSQPPLFGAVEKGESGK
ncbi:MAG: DNA damage-inducible protein D [Chloroflexota bacterium]|nr:DNA damage-inducible protein D [Chloroflexota bacterium]